MAAKATAGSLSSIGVSTSGLGRIWDFQRLGALLGSLYTKDHSILGSIFKPPVFGNSHILSALGLWLSVVS